MSSRDKPTRSLEYMNVKKFSGLGVAMVTPFLPSGALDVKSLHRLLEHLLTEGADYIVVHGTTGESPCLTRSERDEVTDLVVEHVGGRIPIVIGLGGNDTLETSARLRQMRSEGIDAILSVVPYYNKPSQEGLYQHYRHLSEASPLPIILYNVPGRVGINMLPDTVVRLSEDCHNIIGIKEASGFVAQAEQVTSLLSSDQFVVLSGDDALSVPFMKVGARGVISVIGNAYTRLMRELIHLGLEGKMNEADLIQTKLRQVNNYLFANGNPAGIKALLYQMRLIDHQQLRLPLTPVTPEVYLSLEHERRLLDDYIAERKA